MRKSRVALATIAIAIGMTSPAQASDEGIILAADSANAIPGSYLVVLRDGAVSTLAARYDTTSVFESALNGFAARMSEQQAKRLAADPSVAYVQRNQRVHASDTQKNPPSWGLDRVDQQAQPLDQSYSYSTTAGVVAAYVIDTGIRNTHQTFGGRARSGIDTIDHDTDSTDCHGHGTHVAGTIGGAEYGVAKGVALYGVRVLGCDGSGTTETVVAGVEWVTKNARKPAVANMSLGGGKDQVLDDAVRGSVESGITYAIAAGNSHADACTQSPAREPSAITVGATQRNDARAGYSNFGTCLDIFAPGDGIVSSWRTSDTATANLSGTSMAAPHVAGTAALLLAKNPTATPQQVRDGLVASATSDKVTSPGAGSPNKLLFTDSGIEPPAPVPGCGKKTNDEDVAIPDASYAVGTAIRFAGCAGKAPVRTNVEVHIKHSYVRDLFIDLVGPSGTVYRLKNNGTGSGQNIDVVYTADLSKETKNGAWTLQVADRSEGDEGFLDNWSITLPKG